MALAEESPPSPVPDWWCTATAGAGVCPSPASSAVAEDVPRERQQRDGDPAVQQHEQHEDDEDHGPKPRQPPDREPLAVQVGRLGDVEGALGRHAGSVDVRHQPRPCVELRPPGVTELRLRMHGWANVRLDEQARHIMVASSSAAIIPTGPAPTTTTGTLSMRTLPLPPNRTYRVCVVGRAVTSRVRGILIADRGCHAHSYGREQSAACRRK